MAPEDRSAPGGANPWLVAIAVMLATFMEVLDTSIAAVALPYIAGSLSATNDEATWVLTSYLVANAIVLPASSWFSLRFGRKRFLIICIGIFTISSFACGAATSLDFILIARAVQGAGGGALQPLSQAILLESFPPQKRGSAMAVFALGVVVAPVLGPTLGGWLTDAYSWRWAFYINIPVGIFAVFMISRYVQDPSYVKEAKPGKLDGIGLGLLAVWLGCLQSIGYLTAKIDNRWLIVFGFVLFAVASLWFGEVNLSIGQWTFLWAIIISGFGSGCVFVPLSTTTMAFLKNEEIGNASGLYNLLRNIGGSIGISVVNTIVARHEQLHRSELVHSLNPGRVEVQGTIRGMQGYLSAQGASPTQALHRAYGLLAQDVNVQARMWSYVDDFRYMALVCFGCMPIVFALKKSVGRKGAIGAGH